MARKAKKGSIDKVERDLQKVLSDPKMLQTARHFTKVAGHINLGRRFTR